ncbi:MAG: chloramphenicol acetyltransferase [Clostridia bacterium]|nr:chloramphenicol acetyltransferase [Clostridia bacterium]
MERRIDRENWNRNAHDQLFARLEVPFYSVTWRLDVTEAAAYAKRRGISFYSVLIWCTMKATNGVEAFRYELRGDEVYLLDHRNPSYTYQWDEELFGICGIEWIDGEDPVSFAVRMKRAEAANPSPIPTAEADEAGHDVYISSLPWIDYTHISQEFPLDNTDSTPRVMWGRFETNEQGRKTLSYTVQVNHRLIDGIHLSRLNEWLNGAIHALEAL